MVMWPRSGGLSMVGLTVEGLRYREKKEGRKAGRQKGRKAGRCIMIY